MIKSMNIAWWVQGWSEVHPEKTAIIFKEERISYLELHQRANKTSCWLQSIGIRKGERVAVMMNNCPEFIEVYLACARLGAIFVPVNFRLAGPELDYTLNNAIPRLFIFGKNYVETVLKLNFKHRSPSILLASIGSSFSNEVFDYHIETSLFEGQEPCFTESQRPADPEEPHVIMYTSGTTGEPKGAVLSHRKTFFNCLNADIFFKLHFDDIMLVILPLFHSGGLFIQTSPVFYKGATIIIHPEFDSARVYEDIERYGVTKFLGVPTVYRALLKVEPEKRRDLSSLKVCAIGGEKVTIDLLDKCRKAGFQARQVMGQTETSILLWASEEDSLRKPGTVGRPVFHAEVSLVGRNGKSVETGEIGEIVVRGSIMMKEYWRDPIRTEETIRNGRLHTGDLARMDEDRCFYLVDRAKNVYISGGENVYPAEVERVLRECNGIGDVAVIGIPDETWGEVGHAYIIKKKESDISAEDIISYCDGRLARYKWPKDVTFCEEFPCTSVGKVRKSLLIHSLETNPDQT